MFFSRTRYYLTWLHKGSPLDSWICKTDSGFIKQCEWFVICNFFTRITIYHKCWYLKKVQPEAICLKVKTKIYYTDILVSFLRPFLKDQIIYFYTVKKSLESDENISKKNYRPFVKLTFWLYFLQLRY